MYPTLVVMPKTVHKTLEDNDLLYMDECAIEYAPLQLPRRHLQNYISTPLSLQQRENDTEALAIERMPTSDRNCNCILHTKLNENSK